MTSATQKEWISVCRIPVKLQRWYFRQTHTARQTRDHRFMERCRRTGRISQRDRGLRGLTSKMAKTLLKAFMNPPEKSLKINP